MEDNEPPDPSFPPLWGLLFGIVTLVVLSIKLAKRQPLRIRVGHYIPPDVQIGGNGIPQPNQIVSVTFTPDQPLIAGMEVDGEGSYQMLVNGMWGPVTKLPPPFQFTFGGSSSATRTIPAGNWTHLKVIVSSSLKQGGVVTQNDVFTHTY